MAAGFRENVREEMSFQGISAKELSQMTQIPYQTLANYLNSRASMPPADYACRIAKVLHTRVEWLVNGKPVKDDEDILILAKIKCLKTEDKKAVLQLLHSITKK